MRFLSAADPEIVREALAVELPDLEVKSLRLTTQGWDNHTFVLNDEWIVRFPKDEEFQSAQERWVTEALQGVSPVPIPHLELTGKKIAFAGYRMLPGVLLSEAWPRCEKSEREAVVARLVEFCAAMHTGLRVDDALANGVIREDLAFGFVRASVNARSEWANVARRALARVDQGAYADCVVHNDLHGDNILLDSTTHAVAAVIDFGDLAIGDPCLDLNYLLECDLQAAESIARRYAAAGGGEVDPERILDLYFLMTLEDYLDPDMPPDERAKLRGLLDPYLARFGNR